MQRTKELLKVLLLSWWLALSVGLGLWLWRVRPRVEGLLTDLDRTVVIAAGAATNVEKASRAWEQSSKEQSTQTTQAMSNVSAAARELSSFISRTDDSVNSSLLPSLSRAITQQNASLLKSQNDLQANLKEMLAATQQAQKVLVSVNERITDPNIALSLQSVEESTKNLAEGTAQMAAIATDGRQVADKFRQDYLKPQKFAWELLKQLIGLGGSLANMIK